MSFRNYLTFDTVFLWTKFFLGCHKSVTSMQFHLCPAVLLTTPSFLHPFQKFSRIYSTWKKSHFTFFKWMNSILTLTQFYECRSSCQKGPHFLEVQQILDKLFYCKFMLNKQNFSQTQTKLFSLLWQICTICMQWTYITKIIKVWKKKVQKHVSYSYS